MSKLERELVIKLKEKKYSDSEITEFFEDYSTAGKGMDLNLDKGKFEIELRRYNLQHNLTGRKEVESRIEKRINERVEKKIEEIESDPSVVEVEIFDSKYPRDWGIKYFCLCGNFLKAKKVKQKRIIPVIGVKNTFRKEQEKSFLFAYCPTCGDVYESVEGLKNDGVTPRLIG